MGRSAALSLVLLHGHSRTYNSTVSRQCSRAEQSKAEQSRASSYTEQCTECLLISGSTEYWVAGAHSLTRSLKLPSPTLKIVKKAANKFGGCEKKKEKATENFEEQWKLCVSFHFKSSHRHGRETGSGLGDRTPHRIDLRGPLHRGRIGRDAAEEPVREAGVLQDQNDRAEEVLREAQLRGDRGRQLGADFGLAAAVRLRPEREEQTQVHGAVDVRPRRRVQPGDPLEGDRRRPGHGLKVEVRLRAARRRRRHGQQQQQQQQQQQRARAANGRSREIRSTAIAKGN